jgi:hypothetical protein
MTKLALPLSLALILASGCASSDGFVEDSNMCGPGQPIEINAGIESSASGAERLGGSLILLVEVANNSDADIVVEYVRVDSLSPMRDSETRYEIQGARIDPGETIAEGRDHLFEVPLTIRGSEGLTPSTGRRGSADLAVIVGLEGGKLVRCRFQVPF